MSELPDYILDVCKQLALDETQCNMLHELMPKLCRCPEKPEKGDHEHHERRRSRWQECIASRRKGQKFDPEAIKQLAQEYREKKCPP